MRLFSSPPDLGRCTKFLANWTESRRNDGMHLTPSD